MPNFTIIRDESEIALNNTWIRATKFDSKDRLVDERGHKIDSNYQGRQYRIIEKRERTFSDVERFKRGFLGVVTLICTLCFGLFSKSVRNLFTKSRENIRFAVLEEETRFKVEGGKIIYLNPTLLFGGTKISEEEEINFASVKTGGKQKLVPVTGREFEPEHTAYEGSPLDALLKIAQDTKRRYIWHPDRHYESPIGYFLKHPHNSLFTEDTFFKFILEQDEAGTPRICTLNSASTLEVLHMIKEKNIPIKLHEKTPTGDTLFTLWAGKGHTEITKLILELDPSVIDQTQGHIKSPFVEAVLKNSKEEANLLINAMKSRNIVLSTEETWIKRAFKNDLEFSQEEFTQLDQESRMKVYFVANAFGNEDLVKKLNLLGTDTVPIFEPGPHIFARNMNIVTARNVLEEFLKDLRRKGLLLTEEEFSKLDKSNYIRKVDDIGRIQGKNFIEKLVTENELKRIKVPKKIAVVTRGLDNISFCIAKNLELRPQQNQLTVYAERIKSVDRKLSLEEAIEFMIILEKTRYDDCSRMNFIFAEDGIYFIDTEYRAFSPTEPAFTAMKSIKSFIAPEDVEKFLTEYERRKEASDRTQKLREAQQQEYLTAFENPYTQLITGHAEQKFTFALASLV